MSTARLRTMGSTERPGLSRWHESGQVGAREARVRFLGYQVRELLRPGARMRRRRRSRLARPHICRLIILRGCRVLRLGRSCRAG
jgi:hypothetical protein